MAKLNMQKESEKQYRLSAELVGHNDVARMKETVTFLQEEGTDMSQLRRRLGGRPSASK